jgi:hypothetical protein
MNTDLRRRLLITFQTGSAEELAAVLQLIHLLSIHLNKGAGEDITPRPAQGLKCKLSAPNYHITLTERN